MDESDCLGIVAAQVRLTSRFRWCGVQLAELPDDERWFMVFRAVEADRLSDLIAVAAKQARSTAQVGTPIRRVVADDDGLWMDGAGHRV